MSEKKYTVYYSPVAKDDLKSVYSYIAYTLLEKKTAELSQTISRLKSIISCITGWTTRHRELK